MSKQAVVTLGTVAFSNLTQHDIYNGQSTGKYNLVVTLSDAEAQKLVDQGVHLKDYSKEDGSIVKQKKFDTKYHVPVVDLEGEPFEGEIPFGSEVRVAWVPGDTTPQYGLKAYLHKVRLVVLSEDHTEDPEDF